MYWLIEERIITWTEANSMSIVDIDKLAHVHEATLAAQYRVEARRRT